MYNVMYSTYVSKGFIIAIIMIMVIVYIAKSMEGQVNNNLFFLQRVSLSPLLFSTASCCPGGDVPGWSLSHCPLQRRRKRQKMIQSVPVAFVVPLLLACTAPAAAHIHSHKVHHIERDRLSLQTWLLALCSSLLVAACGIFPVLLSRWVRLDQRGAGGLPLRCVLSFALGGLLGDVFLHLLPEAWGSPAGRQAVWSSGLWAVAGVLSFLVVEKVAACTSKVAEEKHEAHQHKTEVTQLYSVPNRSPKVTVNGHPVANDISCTGQSTAGLSNQTSNGHLPFCPSPQPTLTHHHHHHSSQWWGKDVSGYLNLAANCTDNFTHGLAIAASYVASPAVGLLTTLAILCHEVPHEVGDFAILLKSGFSVWAAAKAQLVTAGWAVVGVVAGLTAEQLTSSASWLLPFTAGGFLYIAMVSILPDLLEEEEGGSWRPAALQLILLVVGVLVMAAVTIVEKKSCGHMPPHLIPPH